MVFYFALDIKPAWEDILPPKEPYILGRGMNLDLSINNPALCIPHDYLIGKHICRIIPDSDSLEPQIIKNVVGGSVYNIGRCSLNGSSPPIVHINDVVDISRMSDDEVILSKEVAEFLIRLWR